ncbi:hypothetical protein NBRGN_016_01080 [Nocardia brasiliensis NBRC 14402]|uniref:hypothetical protein n=1 Tax=Nocardia brasiliensis TaxID=37326 RepID=UPI00045CA5BE|nr:hypothetical protein [Nocardia brasiliensis]ASF12473.1 hypothetical protein CEQ30_39725 [Nocardia brasiliensis]GAJ79723.1 hypothetical protein NBRGN_016_01080 [Nocardia brasiliensis NBRC 14402]SUB53453.1 Uncharacterised protein [Nocardia brasiliensis]
MVKSTGTGFGYRVALRATALLTLLVVTSCALLPGERDRDERPAVVVDTAGSFRPGLSVSIPDSLAADFTQLQPNLGGQVGLAIMPVGGGRMTIFGDWVSGIAWSTIKVPLAIAALRHDPDESVFENAEAAITVSDNGAAEALWESLGDGLEAAQAVQDVIDEAGDSTTGLAGPRTRLDYTAFGQTEWTLANQVRFASRLPCLPETFQVPELMAEITPDQSWGLGNLEGAAFKGGWGPDDETGIYTVRQFGVVPTQNGMVAVALAAQADSGTYEDSTAILSRLAVLLGRHLAELRGGTCAH